jgi:hypothetical protein
MDVWEIEPQYVYISHAMETSSATKNCNAMYRLLGWDSNANDFVDWFDLVEDFDTEVPHHFHSWIDFSADTGDFEAEFFYEDLNVLKGTRFTDAEGNVAMKFRILSIMPSSIIHGPATEIDQLIYAEFKITLVADDDVVTCADNTIIQYPECEKTGERRETDNFEYEIAMKDDDIEVLRVHAKTVFSAIEECTLDRSVEYYNPEIDEWETLRSTTRTTMNFEEGEMWVDF